MSYEASDVEQEKEEKRLAKMSIEELKVELDVRMKSALLISIKKLPERIDAHLDMAAWHIITAALGVKKDSWSNSKWEIDTRSEKSAIARELGEVAMAQIKQALPGYIEGLVVQDPRIPPIKSAYQRAYRDRLSQLTNQKVWEYAHKQAEKRFVELMTEVTGEEQEALEDEE